MYERVPAALLYEAVKNRPAPAGRSMTGENVGRAIPFCGGTAAVGDGVVSTGDVATGAVTTDALATGALATGAVATGKNASGAGVTG
ncbi:MAG: hypothetical protein M3R53_02290, partial [Candidatus Eremiobacteraeota bacterium]|nr:hypothetical protein [Candidatus Eremiobacteraeota bacterium]